MKDLTKIEWGEKVKSFSFTHFKNVVKGWGYDLPESELKTAYEKITGKKLKTKKIEKDE